MTALVLDGSMGEGGGQVLRSALSLSAATGQPFCIEGIRARRERPGLLRQHLTAVIALREICGASVRGAELGSVALEFRPGVVRAGEYRFAVGTAGSACLVLQTVLPPLLFAAGPSRVVLEGGTHNMAAPPFDFIERVFLPQLRRMGAVVSFALERWGFYPKGGGRLRVEIEPIDRLHPLDLVDGGRIVSRRARAVIARLPEHIALRELAVVQGLAGFGPDECETVEVKDSAGPGNVLMLEVEREDVTELVTAFGRRGLPAETVAGLAAAELLAYLEGGAPVGPRLADQLMLPLALAGGGRFVTTSLTGHARTNARVIERFLPVAVLQSERGGLTEVRVTSRT